MERTRPDQGQPVTSKGDTVNALDTRRLLDKEVLGKGGRITPPRFYIRALRLERTTKLHRSFEDELRARELAT